MIVLPIKSEEAVPWIMQKHYAKRLPSISYAFGLYENNELIGVVTYGIPASNNLCEGICGKDYKEFVIELNRLCLLNNDKNQSSFLVGNSIKMLPKPVPSKKSVLVKKVQEFNIKFIMLILVSIEILFFCKIFEKFINMSISSSRLGIRTSGQA